MSSIQIMMQRNSDYAKSSPDFIFLTHEDSAVFVFCLFCFFGRLGPCYVALVGSQFRDPPVISFCYTCCFGFGSILTTETKPIPSRQQSMIKKFVVTPNLLTRVENEKERKTKGSSGGFP